MTVKTIMSAVAACSLVCSCNFLSSVIHDDEVVARVGKHKLYRSELKEYIPEGVSSADSVNLALQYINTWAAEEIFNDVALKQLPKEEQDVMAELESYRKSLLRFRYEQRYVADRLDTVVTERQIEEYYKSHKELFQLERPVLKVRFLDIYKSAEDVEYIISKMTSSKVSDVEEADSLAQIHAIKYFDKSEEWMDAMILAKEFGTDYATMLSSMKNSVIRVESSDQSDVKVAYVRAILRSGTAPVEYCDQRIRDYILSNRKHVLLQTLEKELIEKSAESNDFVIY